MSARLLVVVGLLAGCAQSQDLGHTPPASSQNSAQGISPSTTVVAPHADPGPVSPLDVCPVISPVDGARCELNVPWCGYARTDGLVNRCKCGVDKRWVCLVIAETPPRDETAILPVTTPSCSEGAPCGEGFRCTIPRVRTCTCMSSSRFSCTKPAE